MKGPEIVGVVARRFGAKETIDLLELDVSSIRFTVRDSDGKLAVIDVETFVRDGVAGLTVRGEGALSVLPRAANVVVVTRSS